MMLFASNLAPSAGLRGAYRSIRSAAQGAQRARIPQMAAALSFRTIFGLLPVVLVALVVLKVFTPPEQLETLIRAALDRTGISAIALEASAGSQASAENPFDVPNPFEFKPGVSSRPTAPAATRLDEYVADLLERIEGISIPALGLIGAIALIYAAIGMLVEIERAFNQIYRAARDRAWSRRILLYWTLLTLGPLGLLATFYIGNRARAFTEDLLFSAQSLVGEFSAVGIIAVGYCSTVVISGLVLLLLYVAVPNTRVKLRPAVVGAVLAAIAWEAGKWGFAQYIEYTKGESYVRLYGSVALIPLFLLWIYLTWVIILLGLQIAFHIQFRRKTDPASLILSLDENLTDPAAAIPVLSAVAERFAAGRAASPVDIAHDLNLSEPITALLLERLAAGGFVHLVERPLRRSGSGDHSSPGPADDKPKPDSSGQESEADPAAQAWTARRYSLALPAGSIRLRDVLACGFSRGAPGAKASEAASGVQDRLRQAQIEALGDSTLSDALRGDSRPCGARLDGDGAAAARALEPGEKTL